MFRTLSLISLYLAYIQKNNIDVKIHRRAQTGHNICKIIVNSVYAENLIFVRVDYIILLNKINKLYSIKIGLISDIIFVSTYFRDKRQVTRSII